MRSVRNVILHTALRPPPFDLTASEALVEARRCLYCFDAPCTQACPVHVNVAGFIKRLAEDNVDGACQLVAEANPLAAVCGAVCPTADLCEGACVLPGMGQSAIRIGALQHWTAMHGEYAESAGKAVKPGRVAIIGGGPGGLACAAALRRLGHSVDLYEAGSALGGLASQVIPTSRLPQATVECDLARLQGLGISVHLHHEMSADEVKASAAAYDAYFVGTGLRGSRGLAEADEGLSGVGAALDFLERARSFLCGRGRRPKVGAHVVVVGGGNVAVDAAVLAQRLGAERVVVLYRRTLEEMPAWREEYLAAAALGIEFRWLATVKATEDKRRRVHLVEVQPMRRREAGADGRRQVEPDPDAPPYALRCDTLLLALGQELETGLATELDLTLTREGVIAADPATFQTSRPGVFAAGDAVSGGATVVESVAQGLAAGRAIDRWLADGGAGKRIRRSVRSPGTSRAAKGRAAARSALHPPRGKEAHHG